MLGGIQHRRLLARETHGGTDKGFSRTIRQSPGITFMGVPNGSYTDTRSITEQSPTRPSGPVTVRGGNPPPVAVSCSQWPAPWVHAVIGVVMARTPVEVHTHLGWGIGAS